MTKNRKSSPGYCFHRPSGQAYVRLDGKMLYLGVHDTQESRELYHRTLAEWEAAGRISAKSAAVRIADQSNEGLTVNQVTVAYLKHATAYYGWDQHPDRGDRYALWDALRMLKQTYGSTPAAQFGPKTLKAVRQAMIAKGWCRSYVNAQVLRLRRMFAWAASEELLPGSIAQNLNTVKGLRKGKTEAPEGRKVGPVAPEVVEATLVHLSPTVGAMVRVQALTGCRPGEVCQLRAVDLDLKNRGCWLYRPQRHKTEHHDHDRLILFGPKAQEVLRPFLETKMDGYCFSPATAKAEWLKQRSAGRQTPNYQSHVERNARKRKRKPKRQPRDHYDARSYAHAVARACRQAFPLPEQLRPRLCPNGKQESRSAWWGRLTAAEKTAIGAWHREHSWHPNQLRHSRATELRPYGLDVAKTVLGHARVETTQIYAEKDMANAMALIAKIG